MTTNVPTPEKGPIPDYVIDDLARCILPKIQAFYESEDGVKSFNEWKRLQEQKEKVK